jgi:hypothetical protein
MRHYSFFGVIDPSIRIFQTSNAYTETPKYFPYIVLKINSSFRHRRLRKVLNMNNILIYSNHIKGLKHVWGNWKNS